MFLLMFFSAWNESATMDELAHIPAGYSYLTQKDYRLNPEHPPLIKDLSAVPLLLLSLNFPTNNAAWQKDINGQWTMGSVFLYESGNDADKIIRWSRFPIMMLALFFGWMLFKWVRGIYGNKAGLLTLLLFVLSPTFIAHSRYVTTDLAASFGFFIGIIYFVKFLEHQSCYADIQKSNKLKCWLHKHKHLIISGVVFGIAQLLKFSLFILLPLYILLGILWVFLNHRQHKNLKNIFKEWVKIIGKILIIFSIGYILVWTVYQFHVWNYPPEKQLADTEFILKSFGVRPLADLTVWMANKPFLRPFAQYLLGLLMVVQRAAGGNTTYFLGKVSAAGWSYYFPVVYFFKEHLAFHILTLIAVMLSIKSIIKSRQKSLAAAFDWMKDNFILTAGIIFISIYWIQSIRSPLNIGIRHVLPTFPFIYLLVSRKIVRWTQNYSIANPQNIIDIFWNLYYRYIKNTPKLLTVALLIIWMFLGTIFSFPYYLSYYNTFAGGIKKGYKIAVDSNYDWGQDLKRLKDFAEKRNIKNISVDYFGGGSPKYYLGEKFEPWWSAKGKPKGWFAISLTFLQGATAKPVKNFQIKPEDSYQWLRNEDPFARAGTSIYIYNFK
jgi:4-amino-4-deoxy-L-arabinose transferase-like glycosyltransferase